jgi:hypothetical protein
LDGSRFDALTRSLSEPGTRRRVLAGIAAGALGLAGLRPAGAVTCRTPGLTCRVDANCCSGLCAKDATGRRRCRCQSPGDCPLPDACHKATCTAGVCGAVATVDLLTDPANCGRCGRTCPDDPHGDPACGGGVCALACDLGYAPVGGACLGSFGTACAASADCATELCACASADCATARFCAVLDSGRCIHSAVATPEGDQGVCAVNGTVFNCATTACPAGQACGDGGTSCFLAYDPAAK